MNPKFIVIDGKTYHNVDEMPPDVRGKYEQAMRALKDANANHLPDAFESLNIFADQNKNGAPDILENITAGNVVANRVRIIVDGKEFDDIKNLPPEARARYEEAMRKLDANRNGIPDVVEEMINATNRTANVSTGFGAETSPRSTFLEDVASTTTSQKQSLPVDSVITSDASNGWVLALSGVFVLLLCAAGVWYLFLR